MVDRRKHMGLFLIGYFIAAYLFYGILILGETLTLSDYVCFIFSPILIPVSIVITLYFVFGGPLPKSLDWSLRMFQIISKSQR
jgi:hypothetical protein